MHVGIKSIIQVYKKSHHSMALFITLYLLVKLPSIIILNSSIVVTSRTILVLQVTLDLTVWLFSAANYVVSFADHL